MWGWGDKPAPEPNGWRGMVERRLVALEARISALEARGATVQLDRIEAAIGHVLQVVNALTTDPQQLAAATANLKAHTERLQAVLDQVNKG